MISKERLEELIEKGEFIFYILNNNSVALLRLDNSYGISTEEYNKEYNCKPQFYHSGYVYQNICDADKIFETEEDARWELEMTATRTETFTPPTWEEFITKDKTITFYKNQVKYKMYIFVKNKNTNNCRIIIYADDNSQDWLVFEKPATKENYIEACRLAKKLFLGE